MELGGVFLIHKQKKSSTGLQSKETAGPQEEEQP